VVELTEEYLKDVYTGPLQEHFYFSLQAERGVGPLTIQDIRLTVAEFADVPPPKGLSAEPGSGIRRDVVVFSVSRLSTPLPWVFSPSYLLPDAVDEVVVPWAQATMNLSDDRARDLLVVVTSVDPGVVSYYVDVVVRDIIGNIRVESVIKESELRRCLFDWNEIQVDS
jgi:hypothetical protein